MRTPRMTKTKALIASTAALALAAGLTGCGGKDAAKKAAPAAAARAATVVRIQQRPLTGGVEASGVLVSREEAAVGSELSGYRIARVLVEQGARVRAGQPLVQLDDTLLRAQIAQQAAQTAQSEDQAKRVVGLDGQGVLSQEQIETRRFQAKAQSAALAELKTRESRMTITAPVGGLVLERNARPGDVAGGGTTPMFRIARDSLVELEAQVAENDLFRIHVGDAAKVTLPGGQTIEGTVRLIDPTVDAQTKLGKVRIRLPVRDDLRPGGFGRASFTDLSRPVLVAPEKAVRYDANGASVVIVGPDNRVRQTPVKTGQRGGGFVELLDGPPAGSRILLGAASFALEGDVVKPQEAPASAAPGASAR